MASPVALLSSKTCEWYSPLRYIHAAKQVMGNRIELDPASCIEANACVGAERIYTKEDDGLSREWEAETLWLNPPGNKDRRLGSGAWWAKLARHWYEGSVRRAVFLAFSIETLQTAQNQTEAPHPIPTDFPICIPRNRLDFRAEGQTGWTRRGAPHASCIVYLPDRRNGSTLDDAMAFANEFSAFGGVTVPMIMARRQHDR